MRLQVSNPLHRIYEDRVLSSSVAVWSDSSVAPHSETQRIGIGPGGENYMRIMSVHFAIRRQTAATTLGAVAVQCYFKDAVGTEHLMSRDYLIDNTVDAVLQEHFIPNLLLVQTTEFRVKTMDLSTGGTVQYQIGVCYETIDMV